MGKKTSFIDRIREVWATIREVWATNAELMERRMILDRPWTHDELHWVRDEHGRPELHGHVLGRIGRRGPVTSGGWCSCRRASRRASTG